MKAVFFFIHLALAALAAWQGYMIFSPPPAPMAPPEALTAPDNRSATHPAAVPKRPLDPAGNMEASVVGRNLFKVDIDKKTADAPSPSVPPEDDKPLPEKTKLKLTLWGTVAGKTQSANWAVIEDKKKRSQDLYRTGDRIMGAQIKEISRNRVILTMNGKDQMLEVETRPSTGGTSRPTRPSPASQHKPPASSPPKSTGDMLSSLRSRPYMKDGSPAGLLVYGIRPGSQLLSMGLRNGDIIRTINDAEINNSKDLKGLASELDPDLEIRITLSRRGQEREIVYKGADE